MNPTQAVFFDRDGVLNRKPNPHDYGDHCNCRKPKPELLIEAQSDHGIDFSKSDFIGDRKRDIDASREVGCKGVILFESDKIEVEKLDKLIV
jgi:D-glycero-D-manno-heptose 1,7-bisphosphate phosphatase